MRAPARILRNAHATIATPKPRARIQPRELEAARRDAQQLLSEARASADAVRATAEAEAAAIREQARTQGLAEGQAQAAAAAIAFARAEREADARRLDRLCTLARLLAERLVGRELSTQDDTLAAMATTLLDEARGVRAATLHCHPSQLPLLHKQLPANPELSLALEADVTLALGDLRLTTDVGTLDARLGPRLTLLADALREHLGQDRDEKP